ncbi:hypothetical protein CR513_07615, partial [Mucuna pruriens]
MAGNTQQFGVRGADTSRVVSELTKLTSLMRQLAVGQHQQVVQRVCGICTSVEHPTDMCPTLIPGSVRRRIPIWKTVVSEPAIVPAEFESRVACSTKIWTSRGNASSKSSQLSTTRTKIPSIRIPPTTATSFATPTKFFPDRRLSETNVKM